MKIYISRAKLIYIIIIFSVLAILPSWAASETSPQKEKSPVFTLPLLYQKALKEAERIGIAKENLTISKETRQMAKSVLIPGISAFASHNQYPEASYIEPDNYTGWGVQIGQSFTINGRELIALQMSQHNIDKSRNDLTATQASYLYEVSSQFFQVVRAKEEIEIQEAEVTRLRQHLSEIMAKLKLNDATRPDRLRTQAELSGAVSRYNVAKETLATRRAQLISLVNIPYDFKLDAPETPERYMPHEPLEELISTAKTTRPELSALKLQRQISRDNIRLKKSDYWPTVSWAGKYQNFDQSPEASDDTETVSLGIQVDIPIYSGGLRSAGVREAEAQSRQASLNLQYVEKQIRTEVETAYYSLRTAVSSIDALEDQVRFATDNYQAVTTQFEIGLANSVDIMDANTLMVTSQSNLATARLGSQLARLQLDYATGSLLGAATQAIQDLNLEQ